MLVVLLAAAAYLRHTRASRVEDSSQFGPVRVYPPWFAQRGFTYLFSGTRGWGRDQEVAARAFARAGQLVIGIDSARFLDWAARSPGDCLYLPGLLEDYSRERERAADNAQYLAPVLLGSGLGASLVYMAALQSPPTAFDAAVAIDAEPQLALARPFCDHPAAAASGGGQRLNPERLGPNVPTRLLLDAAASPEQREFVTAIAGATPLALAPGTALQRGYRQALASIEAERRRSGIGDLPLAEVPAAASAAAPPRAAFAVLYSGDGGWRDLDRSLADVLAAKGLSVVGVDVLRYFWSQKSPAAAATDLARIIRYYQGHWQRRQVVLIGFSFGADVLPFLASRLPPAVRADLRLLTLLSPERTTAFEVSASGWLGVQNAAGIAIAPELAKLPGLRIQCIYGRDESADSLCTLPEARQLGLSLLPKPGGHHFDQDYGRLADDILAALP